MQAPDRTCSGVGERGATREPLDFPSVPSGPRFVRRHHVWILPWDYGRMNRVIFVLLGDEVLRLLGVSVYRLRFGGDPEPIWFVIGSISAIPIRIAKRGFIHKDRFGV